MTTNALSLLPTKTASCPAMGSAAKKAKRIVSWANKKIGDVIEFDFNHNGTPDHTGILVKINSDGSITTIEGNTSLKSDDNGGCVMLRKRYKKDIPYFVRPKYDGKVTAQMIIGTAYSQLGIKEKPRNSNNVKYNTWFYGHAVRGNDYAWCMTFVEWLFAHALTPIAKPKKKYSGTFPTPTLKKGSKGKNVKKLQKFLTWYGIKTDDDGDYGYNTRISVIIYQLSEGLTPDGVFGKKSYKRALTYKATAKKTATTEKKPASSTNTTTTAKKPATAKISNAQKIVNKAKQLAWAYGTAKKKYAYKTGAPKAVCKKAMKKYGWADNKAEMSDCGNFVSTVVRESGVSKTFKALHGTKTPFPKSEKGFSIVLKGKKIPSGFLKPGDIIRYKKKNGNQHVLFYVSTGRICEASHHNRFGAFIKDEKKYNNSSIAKISTVQVLRAK